MTVGWFKTQFIRPASFLRQTRGPEPQGGGKRENGAGISNAVGDNVVRKKLGHRPTAIAFTQQTPGREEVRVLKNLRLKCSVSNVTIASANLLIYPLAVKVDSENSVPNFLLAVVALVCVTSTEPC